MQQQPVLLVWGIGAAAAVQPLRQRTQVAYTQQVAQRQERRQGGEQGSLPHQPGLLQTAGARCKCSAARSRAGSAPAARRSAGVTHLRPLQPTGRSAWSWHSPWVGRAALSLAVATLRLKSSQADPCLEEKRLQG